MKSAMAKEKSIPTTGSGSTAGSVLSELFHTGTYKRNQGKMVRMVTALTLISILALIAWRLRETLAISSLSKLQWGLPTVLLLAGAWISYRIVQWPRFADFLISVEAELAKVSWPGKTELVRASMVVITMIFSMAFVLFGFDMIWRWLFTLLGVLP